MFVKSFLLHILMEGTCHLVIYFFKKNYTNEYSIIHTNEMYINLTTLNLQIYLFKI